MIRTYSEEIKKLSKKAFLKWYPFRDGLAESEYERLHDDGTGISQKTKVDRQNRPKKKSGKTSRA